MMEKAEEKKAVAEEKAGTAAAENGKNQSSAGTAEKEAAPAPDEGKKESAANDDGGVAAKKDAEIAQLKDSLLRTRADFDNFRKRCIKTEDINKKLAVKDLALDILGINDNLIRASEAALHIEGAVEEAHKSFVEGVVMISKSLEQSLLRHGVEEIEALNAPFNPVFHEAIEFDVSEAVDCDTVTKVHQKGFKIDSMVIRTAKVKVSKPGKKSETPAGDSAGAAAETASAN
jgi:molecular chaperone GrpE